jgi:hypothetical protein
MNKYWPVGATDAGQLSLCHHVSLVLLENIHNSDL